MSNLYPGIFLSVSLTSAVGLATAQSAPIETQAQVDSLEKIIVTAQKHSERLLDVPLNMSVLTKAVLEDARVAQVQDIVMLTPGLEFSETFGRQTTSPEIRGVAPFGFLDPTVLVYVDGFTRVESNALLFDLERTEVLKGPQATLYGRNTLGGVINHITSNPANTSWKASSRQSTAPSTRWMWPR